MPFLTDLSAEDTVILQYDDSKAMVKLRITKKTGNKVRLSIDAGKEVRITKTGEKRKKVKK
jgi:sRNA-binding carbon storage regulator CsrA